MKFLFLIILLSNLILAFAVSPSSIDLTIEKGETKTFNIYTFSNNNEIISLKTLGNDFYTLPKNPIEINTKEIIPITITIPYETEGKHIDKIILEKTNNLNQINLNEAYAIKVRYTISDKHQPLIDSNQIIQTEKIISITNTKPFLNKAMKITANFSGLENNKYLLRGEVYLNNEFIDLIESDIIRFKTTTSKEIIAYFKPTLEGSYEINLKVINNEYESEKNKINFQINQTNSQELYFYILAGIVSLIALLAILIKCIK